MATGFARICIDAGGQRYILPPGLELAPGPLALEDTEGLTHRVRPEDVAPYKATEDEVAKALADQVDAVFEAATPLIEAFASLVAGQPVDLDALQHDAQARARTVAGLARVDLDSEALADQARQQAGESADPRVRQALDQLAWRLSSGEEPH